MDALGDLLAPYSEYLAKIAGSVTCLQFMSGAFLLNDIRVKGSSDGYPPEIFIFGNVLSILSLKLGSIMNDAAMLNVNYIGLAVSLTYFSGFFWFASKNFRQEILRKSAYFGIFTIFCLVYASLENPANIETRFGLLITGLLFYMVGAPLLNLPNVIKKKSTEGMPFPIILCGNITATSWLLYGISIKNSVIINQNLLMVVLGSLQLSMFALFPGTNIPKKKLKEDKKDN